MIEGTPVESDRPTDLMVECWSTCGLVTESVALARLRATWVAYTMRGGSVDALKDGEMLRSSDAPWWCYDPRTDTAARMDA